MTKFDEPMESRETSRAIDDAAARWAAKLDRAPLSPQEGVELDAWLKGNSRRVGAFARAQAIAVHSERARALGSSFNPAAFEPAPRDNNPDRRRLLWGGAAAAAVAVGVGVSVVATRRPMGLETLRGEVRLAPLDDGSVVTINTQTRLTVDYTQVRRTVRLLDGEAFFEVASNPARPFVVDAGDVLVRAVGTAFSVRRIPGEPVQVIVSEGQVEIRRRTGAGRPVAVAANFRAVATETGPAAADTSGLVPNDVRRAMAWREGKIAFEGESLRYAAEAFERYSDTRIVITDPGLANQTVTGLFTATDPAGFAQAVAVSFGVQARAGKNEIVLSP